ncbi:MAG: L-threonylcarbamoyladenylate synthase, partial [Gammaproteobacteria bacterium]
MPQNAFDNTVEASIRWQQQEQNRRKLNEAARLLRAGGLVAFPTETVYGLGALARLPEAVARIYAVKGRPADHPLIVHIAGIDAMPDWAAEIPVSAKRLAQAFWPGPLTLILRKRKGVPDLVTGGQDSVGLRVPGHPVALALLRAVSDGVAAPSANRYGRISPTCADHVREELGEDFGIVLDGGRCDVGLESTIVSCLDETPRVLRPGGIGLAELTAVLGAPPALEGAGAVVRVPGSVHSHYAPRTPLQLVGTDELGPALRRTPGLLIGVLGRATASGEQAGSSRWIAMPDDPADCSRMLYAALRSLDAAGLDLILVERPPEDESWRA